MIMHQNLLEILDVFLNKGSYTKLMRTVKDIILKKRLNKTGNVMIDRNCELMVSCMAKIIAPKKQSRFRNVVDHILQHIDTITHTRAKSLLSGTILLKTPYLPEKTVSRKYTLVLDLDETLVHYKESTSYILVRPYCLEFLQELHKWFELVIFTAAMQDVSCK